MNTIKKRVATLAASAAIAVALGTSSVTATTATAATSSSATTTVHVATNGRAALRAHAPHTRSEAVHRLKQATKTAEESPVLQLLKVAAMAMIFLLKLFAPADVYAGLVAAVKKGVAALQRWLSAIPAWIKSLLGGLSLVELWRALKSLVGLL